jgi:hypothetical protein
MWYWWFVSGLLFGAFLVCVSLKLKKKDGTLVIDQTNPAKDVMRFDIDNLDILYKKKAIVLKVDKRAIVNGSEIQLSQEEFLDFTQD